jgi:hypothetical protein
MKYTLLLLSIALFSFTGYSQDFPGLNANHKKKMLGSGLKIPLPTWLPAGFTLDTFEIKTGKNVPVQEKVLLIQYTKKINDSTWQSFIVEAGFDGLGSLWYDNETVQSPVGKIEYYYQPIDKDSKPVDGSKPKQEDLIMTEWFTVDKTDFHIQCIVTTVGEYQVMGDEDEAEDKYKYAAIAKEDFKKILQSLQVLK